MKNFNIKGEIGIAMKYTHAFCPALFVNYGEDVRLWSQDDSNKYEEEPYYYHYVIYLSELSKEPEPEPKPKPKPEPKPESGQKCAKKNVQENVRYQVILHIGADYRGEIII